MELTDLTPAQQRDLDGILSTMGGAEGAKSWITDRIEEKMKKSVEKRDGAPLVNDQNAMAQFVSGVKANQQPAKQASPLAKMILSVYMRGKDGTHKDSVEFAEKSFGAHSEVTKTLVSNVQGSGGSLVPPSFRDEWTEELTPKVAVRSLNPETIPMTGGSVTIPAITGGTTAHYKGEVQPAQTSQPTTGDDTLVGKELTTLIPISNTWRRRLQTSGATASAESFAQRMGQKYQRLKEDATFIRSAGGKHKPTGMRYLAAKQNIRPANPTVNFQNTLADLGQKLIGTLADADVDMERCGAIMRARSENYLKFQALNNMGHPFFLEMMLRGELLGYPYRTTSQIPGTLGVNGNHSEIYFADFAELWLAEEMDMQVSISGDATYVINGVTYSAFQRGETLIKLDSSHDFGVAHDEAIAVLTEVTWGHVS